MITEEILKHIKPLLPKREEPNERTFQRYAKAGVALKALQRFKVGLGTNKKLVGKSLGNQYVFQTQEGTYIAPSNFSRSYRSLRDKLGFTGLTEKLLRDLQK